jgi:membrane protease YdiL (CAAX protease family)
MIYDRNTLTDFVVCSSLSFLLLIFANKMDLPAPSRRPYGQSDKLLAGAVVLLFSAAWGYGFVTSKVTLQTASKSLAITLVYIYYAWIQHFLVQRYLAIRIHQYYLAKGGQHTARQAALTVAIGFAILHIPYPHLLLPSFMIGLVFVYYYLTTGRLWAVVIAHAMISSASLFWYLNDNPFTELHMIIPYLAEEGLK